MTWQQRRAFPSPRRITSTVTCTACWLRWRCVTARSSCGCCEAVACCKDLEMAGRPGAHDRALRAVLRREPWRPQAAHRWQSAGRHQVRRSPARPRTGGAASKRRWLAISSCRNSPNATRVFYHGVEIVDLMLQLSVIQSRRITPAMAGMRTWLASATSERSCPRSCHVSQASSSIERSRRRLRVPHFCL